MVPQFAANQARGRLFRQIFVDFCPQVVSACRSILSAAWSAAGRTTNVQGALRSNFFRDPPHARLRPRDVRPASPARPGRRRRIRGRRWPLDGWTERRRWTRQRTERRTERARRRAASDTRLPRVATWLHPLLVLLRLRIRNCLRLLAELLRAVLRAGFRRHGSVLRSRPPRMRHGPLAVRRMHEQHALRHGQVRTREMRSQTDPGVHEQLAVHEPQAVLLGRVLSAVQLEFSL